MQAAAGASTAAGERRIRNGAAVTWWAVQPWQVPAALMARATAQRKG